ncbi:hypothetical protein HPO96_15890 [Kribbella sandramycini]|uniref:DUF8175 domain-containing protein n=1 Tax=Kribbella sandramycini TaxID=60450 RepID=A0A7Y4KZW8_9ACTN|nr:hypothetical protein [Kribbella sandramycini]MBB6565461.1 hypothetical protein [Kribbella sandramycini]NOL41729.1 hypothetical protein [Kribbella sandramycini]
MGLFSRSSDDDADGGGPTGLWQERGFLAAAIVVGAILICVALWFFVRDPGTSTSNPQPTPVVTGPPSEQPSEEPTEPVATPTDPVGTTTPSAPPVSGKGGCKTVSPAPGIPRIAPAGVTWQFEDDMLFPTQQEAGPALMSARGVRSCFAHSPTGAVFATFTLLAQIKNPALTPDVLANRIAPSKGRTVAIEQNKATPTPFSEVKTAQFVGFKVLDYQPNRAIVSIAVAFDERRVAALPVTMVWTSGDWKGLLQADGSFNGTTEPDLLGSMAGYVRFKGA